jgi:hypothetical protein
MPSLPSGTSATGLPAMGPYILVIIDQDKNSLRQLRADSECNWHTPS